MPNNFIAEVEDVVFVAIRALRHIGYARSRLTYTITMIARTYMLNSPAATTDSAMTQCSRLARVHSRSLLQRTAQAVVEPNFDDLLGWGKSRGHSTLLGVP